MTDEEMLITWTACDFDPRYTIANFRRRGSDRQWRLFAVACCRRLEHLLLDKRQRHAINVAEKHADGAATDSALTKAYKEADKAYDEVAKLRKSKSRQSLLCAASAALWCASLTGGKVVELSCHCAYNAHQAYEDHVDEVYAQAYLLQDVFGGKKPTVKFDPEWLTSTVVALARGIYKERAFDRMPILADALQDAGCENKRILEHCRDTKRVHVRGCWVIDRILGKE